MQISDHLFRFEDTCHVYVLTAGSTATLIDFGAGDVLDHLDEFGVERVTDILMTHHHRDQGQGLPRAATAGFRIWVPPIERDLFAHVAEHWQARGIDNYYNLRQDRFSVISSVPVHAVVPEYRELHVGGFVVTTIPTPGHTTGSVSYCTEIDGRRVAFTGDLIYGPGQVWSLAATQWQYNGHGGLASTVLSLHEVLAQEPDLALPSHGEPMPDFPRAVAETEPPLRRLIDQSRSVPWDLDGWRLRPFEPITPHLLRNRTANAQYYVLLSDTGGALFIDFGYDMDTGWPAGEDRAARRGWLPSLRALKRDFGVERIEVVIPTHYHDDHVAGINLLRDVEGTQMWAEAGIAGILADPTWYDLPCLYVDPIPTDRVVPTEVPLPWHEYEITLYPLPGHCHDQVAISTVVDGVHVLATGDQEDAGWIPGHRPEMLNYQYKNGFRPDDYVTGAKLYQRLRPDLMLTGHWGARTVDDAFLDHILAQSQELVSLHDQLLSKPDVDMGPGDFAATIHPYVTSSRAGLAIELQVQVRNPLPVHGEAVVSMVIPQGWQVRPSVRQLELDAGEQGSVWFIVTSPESAGRLRRAVLAADLSVNGRRFGQRAECFVDLT